MKRRELLARAAMLAAPTVVGGGIGVTRESRAPIDMLKPGIWTTHRPMPSERQELVVVALGDRVIAIGGLGELGAAVPTVDATAVHEAYDPAADRWTRLAPLPVARDHLAAVAFPGRVWAIGGRSSFAGEAPFRIFNATERYEVAGRRWIAKEPMPTPRHGIGAAWLDGRIWIPGGGTSPGLARTTANEAYRP